MQQGGEGGSKSQYGVLSEMSPSPLAAAITSLPMGMETDQPQLVEAASPISSRPPASGAVNLDELMSLQVQGGGADEDALAAAGDEGDRGEGVGSGNRWPRQETLALLKIRSEMDAAFRDATLKGPLWENVSRKLAELGYKRSAKKCKEKFENVHKYYKRTKEGRAGRQDGKSYKFFSELEALHSSAPSSSNASASQVVTPNPVVSIGMGMVSNPIPISSIRVPQVPPGFGVFPSDPSAAVIAAVVSGSATTPTPVHVHVPPRTTTQIGISFSSNSSSSSPESDDDSLEGEPSNVGSSRKRKRVSSKGGSGTRRMMEFFENLMKQVMSKQEVMQQRFLEAIERREQDRMIREEAWKRQEMARLAREHDLMAQDRAISASRDAAIVAFLQKITGQTIQLPTPVSIPVVPPPAPFSMPMPTPTSMPTPTPTPPAAPPPSQQHQQQVQHHHDAAEVVMAIPEQQVPPQDITMSGGGGSFEPSSSRWPKAEVIALIKMRSGLESRYQEAGPKGPLWEEISAGMQRMGYKRSAKRCKEKWENINKYYKKVKESNKKRPEDAKTCPYFHQLDALYRKKILGGSSSGGQNRPEQQQQENIILDPISATKPPVPVPVLTPQEVMPTIQVEQHNTVGTSTAETENKNEATTDVQAQASASRSGILFGGEPKKPEDIVKELMEQQKNHQQLIEDDYDNIDEEEEEEEDEDDELEVEEERKMGNYKIDFQRQSAWPSNEEENGTTSFLAVV